METTNDKLLVAATSLVQDAFLHIAGELGLPADDVDEAALAHTIVHDLPLIEDLQSAVRGIVGASVCGAFLDANDVPRVTADVEFEFWDSAFDVCHLVEEHAFDCTAALEAMTRGIDDVGDLEAFLGYDREEDGFDSDPDYEMLDELYRTSAGLGLVAPWHGPFSCCIASGWDEWARDRLHRGVSR